MQLSYETGQDDVLQPTIRTWNLVVRAFALTRSTEALKEITRVLSKLNQLYSGRKTDVLPNCDTYCYLLRALPVASFGGLGTADKVLDLINRMENLSVEGMLSIKPDTKCHNVHLRALFDSMDDDIDSAPDTARKAEAYLREMAPDTDPSVGSDHWSYNSVLTLWSKSVDVELVSRAETLIEAMESPQTAAPLPTRYEYNSLISCSAWSTSPHKGARAFDIMKKMTCKSAQNPSQFSDAASDNAVANCLLKSKHPEAVLIIESFLEELNIRYKETRNGIFKVTS
jgi:hypothetical protein